MLVCKWCEKFRREECRSCSNITKGGAQRAQDLLKFNTGEAQRAQARLGTEKCFGPRAWTLFAGKNRASAVSMGAVAP